jgi:hypothetical protein
MASTNSMPAMSQKIIAASRGGNGQVRQRQAEAMSSPSNAPATPVSKPASTKRSDQPVRQEAKAGKRAAGIKPDKMAVPKVPAVNAKGSGGMGGMKKTRTPSLAMY